MSRNNIEWSEQEHMMAGAYANIASSFSQITAYMKNHLRTVQNGGGIITNGDFEEIFQKLSDMINNNLRNVSQIRVNITTNTQLESKQPKKIKISETELNNIINESIQKILSETEFDWRTVLKN